MSFMNKRGDSLAVQYICTHKPHTESENKLKHIYKKETRIERGIKSCPLEIRDRETEHEGKNIRATDDSKY